MRPPVKSTFGPHDAYLFWRARSKAMSSSEFDRAFRRFRACGQQEDFLQLTGSEFGESFHEVRALTAFKGRVGKRWHPSTGRYPFLQAD